VSTIVLPHVDGVPARPLLLVTVGSDHHPFDRLVGWVDAWLSEGGSQRVNCVMQYGTSSAPSLAVGEPFMDHDLLQKLMHSASIIVMQGGPMGLLEARKQGAIPISVPRRRDLGEVVDDHQVAFCRHMEAMGDTVLVEDEAALRTQLEAALTNPTSVRSEPVDYRARTRQSIARFAEEADALLVARTTSGPGRYRIPRPRRSARSRQLL
jgi:UDP-N-acetylglucosamine transferase subunit ALG13